MNGNSFYPPGWVAMEHLLLIYTNDDFLKEHRDEFYTYTGNIHEDLEADWFFVWEWPGSGSYEVSWEKISSDEDITLIHAYKDGEKREWVFLEMPSWRHPTMGWVCVDDPKNWDIPVFYPAPKPTKWSPDGVYDWLSADFTVWPPVEPPEWSLPDLAKSPLFTPDESPLVPVDNKPNLLLIISLSATFVIGMVVLIRVLWVRKNESGKERKKRTP